jgi:hypothetical protein
VRYEQVYLQAYTLVSEAKVALATYFALYNARRPGARLDRMAPDQAVSVKLCKTVIVAVTEEAAK